MAEHTGASYETIAANYAATVDAKPWNAYYERPAVVSLLPTLKGARVLDVGCGSGWYAEYLLQQGADVTSFDFNAHFVELTQARVQNWARGQIQDGMQTRASVLQADLSQPLAFAANGEFDLAVCPLVLHYLRDWHAPLKELQRVLKPGGVLVFSTHHPFNDWKLFNTEDYFATDLLHDEWEGVGKVSFYRRPLTAMCDALHSAGFWIEQILEPRPTDDFRRTDPALYEKLMRNPWFLVFRAMKQRAVVAG